MNNLTYRICLLIAGLSAALTVSAQQITGVVKDTGGQPLAGVSVFIDGTTTGASTDVDGKYSLDVQDAHGKTLVFSFIGMRTQEVRIGSSLVYDIVMEERDGEEVKRMMGVRTASDDAMALYPAFDMIRPELVSGIITREGVI